MLKKYVIIVAGGQGTRMNTELPKQYLLIEERPVLMHTINCFLHGNSLPDIVLVLHRDMHPYWADLCMQHGFQVPHHIVYGGDSRFESVRNGLQYILETETAALENVLIAIHDAARPVVSQELVDRCFSETIHYGATTAAVQSTNSIRLGDIDKSIATDRQRVWIVQTPQTFRADILKKAFTQPEMESFTDDASVVEKMGYPVRLIPGDQRNIKITFPEDLAIAHLYLKTLDTKPRLE